MTLDEWVARVADELGVEIPDSVAVLDLARDVAHGVARPAAPLTCLLVGLAVGAGQPIDAVLARVQALIPIAAEGA